MSIQRLRQVLSSNFTVSIDTSQATVAKVRQLATAREQSLADAGKPPSGAKGAQLDRITAARPLPIESLEVIEKTQPCPSLYLKSLRHKPLKNLVSRANIDAKLQRRCFSRCF